MGESTFTSRLKFSLPLLSILFTYKGISVSRPKTVQLLCEANSFKTCSVGQKATHASLAYLLDMLLLLGVSAWLKTTWAWTNSFQTPL
jgi:hypothetical protein